MNINLSHFRGERGFTIVELMVAVALSSIVVLSIGSLFASNSRTLRVQSALMDINETGRYALDRMARDVRMVGFRATGYNVPGGESLTNSLIATAGISDSLTVIYEAPFDCNRAAANAAGLVQNEFRVVNDNLECNNQVLVRGVEELRVLLGEDLDGDLVPNRYVLATAPGLDMNRVVTVQLRLLVRSNADNVAPGAQPLNLAWNKSDLGSNHLRQEYSLTVALRNRI